MKNGTSHPSHGQLPDSCSGQRFWSDQISGGAALGKGTQMKPYRSGLSLMASARPNDCIRLKPAMLQGANGKGTVSDRQRGSAPGVHGRASSGEGADSAFGQMLRDRPLVHKP